MSKARKVKVGKVYRFEPVFFDILNPPFDAKAGDLLEVVNLPGCPKASTMGMCHVKRNGKFAGMVCTNSLIPV